MCPTFDSNLAARNRNLIIFLVPGFLMDEQATSFLSWLLNLFLFFLRRCIKNCMEASFCFFNFDITCFKSVSSTPNANECGILFHCQVPSFTWLLHYYLTKNIPNSSDLFA